MGIVRPDGLRYAVSRGRLWWIKENFFVSAQEGYESRATGTLIGGRSPFSGTQDAIDDQYLNCSSSSDGERSLEQTLGSFTGISFQTKYLFRMLADRSSIILRNAVKSIQWILFTEYSQTDQLDSSSYNWILLPLQSDLLSVTVKFFFDWFNSPLHWMLTFEELLENDR